MVFILTQSFFYFILKKIVKIDKKGMILFFLIKFINNPFI